MQTLNYTITDPMGVHARPAGIFVKEAAKFPCAVKIKKGDKEVDAKRIIAVMSLGVKQGEEITLTTDGDDEENAIKALGEFLKENL